MFLGVDGGGTKTAFCLLDAHGRIVAQETRGSCAYLAVGMDEAAQVLDAGVRSICARARIESNDIAYAFFGLPAYGEVSSAIAALDALPGRILGHARYHCDNDMVCGWAGSLGAMDGINVLAGTGSMTYGEYRGRGVRCGGWGETFGDEGSAYWIARRGLNVFSRMSDGRLDKSPLYDLLGIQLELATDLDLVDVVLHQWRSDRARIADLARVVGHAAHADDANARQILEDAAAELALIVDATRRRLAFEPSERVPVSYSGGVFQEPIVVEAMGRELAASKTDYALRPPLYRPVVGGALYAARLAGTTIEIVSDSS